MLAVALAAIVSNKRVEAAISDTSPATANDPLNASSRVIRLFIEA
jgi:hypothetical protein